MQNADDGHQRQYTCAVEKKKVSYVNSHQTTFARDCANVVVNTSRPFSLQEKHVSFRLGYMTRVIRLGAGKEAGEGKAYMGA